MITCQDLHSLELKNVRFAYESGGDIFEDFSLKVPAHRAIWLRAHSGAGKSTLLRILAGLSVPSAGGYWINDQNVTEMSFEEFLPYRLSIGYGFDLGGLLNNMTLFQNLLLPLAYHKLVSPEDAVARVGGAMDFFGLSAVAERRPFSVSGSQRKLTCMIRPFILQPQLVLLDDPGTGLKKENMANVAKFIEESFEHKGLRQVIFTGEDPSLAKALDAKELWISKTKQENQTAA